MTEIWQPTARAGGTRVLTVERWGDIHQIVSRALAAPPDRRSALVEELCADDQELLEQVKALLADDQDTVDLGPSPSAQHLPEIGGHIGPYRIIDQLGSGGMGVVYLAERDDVGKRVALKLVTSLTSKERIDRALAEQRILARLEHPNIAQLVDAGRTRAGSPFFAMEYVDGERIDDAMRSRPMSSIDKAKIFADVCRAVHFAHQRAVVHRDLKPSNIFLTQSGEVKLLDFGIAKLLDEREDNPALTRTGVRLLTPAYASPEQVRGETVTTVSDVYSLGVVLYELLSGRSPYSRTGTPAAAEAAVLEEDPVAPSRASTHDLTRPTPERRAEESHSSVDADLDAITLKALRKEPEARYASAERMAEDLERYVAGLPVAARGDNQWYRARRFIRRQRMAVAVATLVLGLLVAWAVSASVQARDIAEQRDRAQLEAAKSQTVIDFLVQLFAVSDPQLARGEEPTARELLERGAVRIDDELADQADVRAHLMVVMGQVYLNLGLVERANDLLQGAQQSLEKIPSDSRRDQIMVYSLLGDAALHRGDFDAAYRNLEQAVELSEAVYGERSLESAHALENLGHNYLVTGRPEPAEELFRRALALYEPIEEPDSVTMGWIHRMLGESIFRQDGRHEEGLSHLRKARAIFAQLPNADISRRIEVLNHFGSMALEYGNLDEARSALEESEALTRAMSVDKPHPELAYSLSALGSLYAKQGDDDAAEAKMRESVEVVQTVWGKEHPKLGMALLGLARHLALRNDPAAEPLFRESISVLSNRLAEDHPHMAAIQFRLAEFLFDQGRVAEALPMTEQVVTIRQSHYGADNQRTAEGLLLQGECLSRLGRHTEAEPLLIEAQRVFEDLGPDDAKTRTQSALEELYDTWPGRSRASSG